MATDRTDAITDTTPTAVTDTVAETTSTAVTDTVAETTPTAVTDTVAETTPTAVTDTVAETTPTETTDTVAETTPTETTDDATKGLEDTVTKAKDHLLGLLEQGQAGATKGYEAVIDRIEKFDVQALPGYDRLAKIDGQAFSTDALSGYVDQAGKLVKEQREAVSKAIADRRN